MTTTLKTESGVVDDAETLLPEWSDTELLAIDPELLKIYDPFHQAAGTLHGKTAPAVTGGPYTWGTAPSTVNVTVTAADDGYAASTQTLLRVALVDIGAADQESAVRFINRSDAAGHQIGAIIGAAAVAASHFYFASWTGEGIFRIRVNKDGSSTTLATVETTPPALDTMVMVRIARRGTSLKAHLRYESTGEEFSLEAPEDPTETGGTYAGIYFLTNLHRVYDFYAGA